MALPGESFEIVSEGDNPFRATIASDADYLLGRVRIVPPFSISDEYLELISTSDIGVRLTHEISTSFATLLTFYALEIGDRDAREAVEITVLSLLRQLGSTASEASFLHEYGI